MNEIEEIKRNITYVQGPQGQTVVIVPPEREATEEEANICICYCCVVSTIILGSICSILGIIYGAIILSIREEQPKIAYIDQAIVKAAIWLLAIGAFFGVISVCIFRYVGHVRSTRRRRLTYKDGSGGQRIATTDAEEDNEGGFVSRSEMPSRTDNLAQDQRFIGSQVYGALPRDYGRRPSPSAAVMRHDIPPERGNYLLYDSEQRGVSSSDYRPQFYQPGRPYTDAMHQEAASQFRSSPVTDRSFSPASDTTYLSHYSTRSEAHTTPMN